MKTMKYYLLLAVSVLGLGATLRAEEAMEYPRISFVGQGKGGSPAPDQYLKLVVEGPYLSFEKNQVPDAGAVDYVNNLLRIRNVSFVAVYTREGIKYGDVIRAIDVLRKTTAKNVGVSMIQLAPGREP